VKARATKRFWTWFGQLPGEVRDRARSAFELWIENPGHPGLRFRRIHGTRPIYSVRFAGGWRALGLRDGDTVI
jgi:hypothetical protein